MLIAHVPQEDEKDDTKDGTYSADLRMDKDGLLGTISLLDAITPSTLDKVQAILLHWERKYHCLWDQDKDAFIR